MTPADDEAPREERAGATAPPILPFRPNPDDGCWEHATFVLWLLSRHRPGIGAGEGKLFAMARTLAAHRGNAPPFVVGLPDEGDPFDLLFLGADGSGTADPQAALARLGPPHPAALALIGGLAAAPWRSVAEGYEATTIGERNAIAVLRPASAAPDATLAAAAMRAAAAACAPTNAEWLLRQRLAELSGENARLRGRLARLSAQPARAEALAIDTVRPGAPDPAPAASTDDDLTLRLARAMRRGGRMLPRPLKPAVRAAILGGLRFGRWGHGIARRHVWRRRARAVLREGDFFDAAWYRARYPEVDASGRDPMSYFLRVGMWQRHEVSPRFSGSWYLSSYPDIAAGPYHPLLHYLWMGQREGRQIRDHTTPSTTEQAREEIAASGLFDPDWYLGRHPELRTSGEDPFEHFLSVGLAAQAEASPDFDGARYLRDNPDVQTVGLHPLLHYIRFGRAEGRIAHAHPPAATSRHVAPSEVRAFSLHLSPATLFRVTVGLVVPHERDVDLLRRATAAATAGLDGIGQKAADRILVLDLAGRLSPGVLADWPAVVVPPRRGLSPTAAHNHLANIAFAQGSDIHVVLSAQGVLRDDALETMIRMVRAAGRQAIVGATRASPAGEEAVPGEPPWLASPAIAIPRAIWQAAGGFDTDFACEGADIDLSWRVRTAGFTLVQCPEALFDDAGQETSDAAQLAGALTLARKWGLPDLEGAATRRSAALGLPDPARSLRSAPDVAPSGAPPLEAVIAPW